MRFEPSDLAGAWLIEPELHHDDRGFFGRTFCAREFERLGLVGAFVQHSVSRSHRQGTVRGMHFQRPPHQEVKVVTCLKGAIWDVIVDLRRDSPSFGRWRGFELTEANRRRIYIPEGFAHGQQALTDECEIGYLISQYYVPEAACGIRFDDAALAIEWPLPVSVLSDRDRSWPALARA